MHISSRCKACLIAWHSCPMLGQHPSDQPEAAVEGTMASEAAASMPRAKAVPKPPECWTAQLLSGPVKTLTSIIRSEKSQNESSPNFFEVLTRILPRISLRIFSEFFEDFSCFVSWETETRKNSPKIPAIFQCKIPRQILKKIHKMFLERRQSNP